MLHGTAVFHPRHASYYHIAGIMGDNHMESVTMTRAAGRTASFTTPTLMYTIFLSPI